MAGADQNSPRREPVEHTMEEPFNLQRYVFSQAQELDCYWPDYNAEMSQAVLQADNIENGTYILRPSRTIDEAKNKFITLSIRMDFPNERNKVWHFPVIVGVEKNGEGPPTVHFSLTQTGSTTSHTLSQLLQYHHARPLRGGGLPSICRVVQGLPYRNLREVARTIESLNINVTSKSTPVYEYNPIESEDVDNGESTGCAQSRAARPACIQSSVSQRIPRTAQPTPPPRSRTLPLQRRQLQPIPLPRRNAVTPRSSDSSASNDSMETESATPPVQTDEREKLCRCGLPIKVTALPKFWSVHRSTCADTLNMLYFRNPGGQTAWALPPYIDRDCTDRSYLQFGKLNIACFEQYASEMIYESTSELSRWGKYSTYEPLP
ncbi:uncharacterized protein [Watersipora subatra]|uniref:uncharacterized protein isoform X2 n=1 Tax=Watersipora subatra TaxID=2589382 RepID=UPI00355BABA6